MKGPCLSEEEREKILSFLRGAKVIVEYLTRLVEEGEISYREILAKSKLYLEILVEDLAKEEGKRDFEDRRDELSQM